MPRLLFFSFSTVDPPLHFVRDFFAEQTRGLHAKHHDQDGEGKGVGKDAPIRALDDALADTDEKRPHHGAGNGADTAEYCRYEGPQSRQGAGQGDDGLVVGEVQQGADGRQQRADDEGHGDHAVDPDAHELRGFKIPGHGPHGHADPGVVDELGQGRHQKHHQHRRDHRHILGGYPRNGQLVGQTGQSGVHLGQAAGDVGRQILQQIADTNGGDHHRHPGGCPQRLVGRPLDDEAQQHSQNDHQGNGRSQRQAGAEVDHHQTGYHEYIAVSKVDQPQDAVDHGVADGDEGVLPAQRYAGEQNGDAVLHGEPSLFFQVLRGRHAAEPS